MTGLPCPSCYLTRATSAALVGDIGGALQWHAFGPLVAVALLWWSITALRQHRLLPRLRPTWPLGWGAAALVAYWLLRLWLSLGLGLVGFPAFPAVPE